MILERNCCYSLLMLSLHLSLIPFLAAAAVAAAAADDDDTVAVAVVFVAADRATDS